MGSHAHAGPRVSTGPRTDSGPLRPPTLGSNVPCCWAGWHVTGRPAQGLPGHPDPAGTGWTPPHPLRAQQGDCEAWSGPRGVSAGKTLILSLCPHLKNTNNKVCPIKMGRELTEEGSGVLSPEPTRIIIIMFFQSDGAKLQPQHVSSPPSVLFFLAVPGLRRYHTRAFTFSFL